MKVILNEPYYKTWFLELQDMFVEAITKITEQKKEIEELRKIIAAKPSLSIINGGIRGEGTGAEKGSHDNEPEQEQRQENGESHCQEDQRQAPGPPGERGHRHRAFLYGGL